MKKMKKLAVRSCLLMAVTTLVGLSSCKDEFTEEDLLNAQEQISLTLQIADFSTGAPVNVSGATVEVTHSGATTTMLTSDDNGLVTTDVALGSVLVKVTKEGYSDIKSAILDISNASSGELGQAYARIPVFSESSTAEFKAAGDRLVTYEEQPSDEDKNVPDGLTISAQIDKRNILFNSYYVLTDIAAIVGRRASSASTATGIAELVDINYEKYTATTSSGAYTLKVPAILSTELYYTIVFPNFIDGDYLYYGYVWDEDDDRRGISGNRKVRGGDVNFLTFDYDNAQNINPSDSE